MEKIASIAKNTSYFTAALILQKVVSFSYFTILARNLIPEDLGKFYFAVSFTTIFAIFIDLGLANVLTREVAKQGKDEEGRSPQKLLSAALALKIPLAAASVLAVVILVNILGYPSLTKLLVYISCVSMTLDSFTLAFFAVIRGFHNLKFESIASVVFQLIALIFGVAALRLELGLPAVIAAFAFASIFNFIFSLSLIKFKWRLSLKPVYDRAIVKWLVAITIPFALYAVFQRLYTYLDTVFLSLLADDHEVGLYQIAFKVVLAFQFLPMAFTASLYPAFASYWKHALPAPARPDHPSLGEGNLPGPARPDHPSLGEGTLSAPARPDHPSQGEGTYSVPARPDHPSQGEGTYSVPEPSGGPCGSHRMAPAPLRDRNQLAITFERAMKYLMIISVPISVGIIILADKIIVLFRPEYAAAVPALQIAVISLVFLFLNFPPGALLNACDRQKINTRNMGLTLIASIILNVLLIPRYGAVGASLTLAATSFILFSLNLQAAGKIITGKNFALFKIAIKVAICAGVMGAIIHILKHDLYIFLNIILGALVYFAALYLLKGFRKEDVASIIKSFSRNS